MPAILGSIEKNQTAFVPTREWQIVKKGTPIPKGIHVRHNFQTGVTEAKLLDKDDSEDADSTLNHSELKSLTLHPDKAVLQSENETPAAATEKSDLSSYPLKELKERLKKMKQDEKESGSESDDETARTKVKQKFRDYETLKKELKALELNVTTESELLTGYLEKFESHKKALATGTLTVSEIEEVLDILYNLEYLLHHIDNAKVFTDMLGMNKIISPCLNATNNAIKAEGLRLLGAAVQSNPKVQIKALENDFVQKLLHILSTNNKIEVKSRCLFALSALIRQFPAAQKVWLDHGGVEIFGKILNDDQLQVQIKVMKLINDLITERQNLQEITDPENREQKTRAYALADIQKKLLGYNYCVHMSSLMTKSITDRFSRSFASENDEFLETILESMTTIIPICRTEFVRNKNSLLSTIVQLLYFYQNFDANGQSDQSENVRNMMLLIKKLLKTLSEVRHDEL